MMLQMKIKMKRHQDWKNENQKVKLQYIQPCLTYKKDVALMEFKIYFCYWFIFWHSYIAVIPLLMIQVFDTYAFLCFIANNYCTVESEFMLHLQTVVTFAF